MIHICCNDPPPIIRDDIRKMREEVAALECERIMLAFQVMELRKQLRKNGCTQ